jgi:GTPase SAR1 family protein
MTGIWQLQRALIDEVAIIRDISTDLEEKLPESSALEELARLERRCMDISFFRYEVETGAARLNVAVIGGYSAGKSSFINSLLGEPLCPVADEPTTSSVTEFTHADLTRILDLESGDEVTSQEYAMAVRHPPPGAEPLPPRRFRYFLPLPELGNISLIDTPGFDNPRNPHDADVTGAIAAAADIVFFVLDANVAQLTDESLRIIRSIRQNGHGVWYLVLNKVDRKTSQAAASIREKLQASHSDLFAGVFGYSAMEVLALRDLRLEDALAELAGRVRAHVSHREPFHFPLQARKEGRHYVVDLKGEQRVLTGRVPEGAYSERDVVRLFRTAIETKRDLLRRRLERDLGDYHHQRGHVAWSIRADLEAEAEAQRDEGPEAFARALAGNIRALCDDYETSFASAIDHAVRGALEKRALSKNESFFVKWPNWRIVISLLDVRGRLEADTIWDGLESDLRRLIAAVETDCGGDGAAERMLPLSAIKYRVLDASVCADTLLPAIELEFRKLHGDSFATHVVRSEEDAGKLLEELKSKLALQDLGAIAVGPLRRYLEGFRSLALQMAGASRGRDAVMLEGWKTTLAKVAKLEQMNA